MANVPDFRTLADRVATHEAHIWDDGIEKHRELTLRRQARLVLPADAAAGDETNYMLMRAEQDIRLKSVYIAAAGDVAEDAANYAVLDLNKENGAAGGLTSIDATDTQTGSGGTLAARVARAFTIEYDDTLDAGEWLVLEVTKAAAGVVITDLTVDIDYELR
jgi:hypothetical protein